MTLGQLSSLGLTFEREFDMGTGWVFRTTGKRVVKSHAFVFSLGFELDVLKRVSFAFVDTSLVDTDLIFLEHNAFLRQEIGLPNNENEHQVAYVFRWGEIVSEVDPRNGTAYILVRWV